MGHRGDLELDLLAPPSLRRSVGRWEGAEFLLGPLARPESLRKLVARLIIAI